MFYDCVHENCTCYFWERKLTSLIIAGASAGGTILLLDHFTDHSLEVKAIAAFAVAVGTGFTSYVISSESYCHYESLFGRNERVTMPYMGDVDQS